MARQQRSLLLYFRKWLVKVADGSKIVRQRQIEAVESGDDDDENAETREQHASFNAPAISSRCRVKQRWCIFVVH
eukprot:scaffold5153_cov93-Skeletonema_menzelii.AAC.1